jgi:hypothetical protein
MEWEKLELRPLLDLLKEKANNWEPAEVLPRTKKLGLLVIPQLHNYKEGKYRRDRNEVIGLFDAITKFIETGLPIALDHFESIVDDYKSRISPYPHYSGIKVVVPQGLQAIDDLSPADIPVIEKEEEVSNSTSMKLL